MFKALNVQLKPFLTYALKWQLGFIVTIPSLYFFIDYCHLNYVWATILMQIIGAVVFYPIDSYIFKKQNKDAPIKTHNP